MKKKKTISKTSRAWTWAEIKLAVKEIYDERHHRDDWGVRVVYEESMLTHLKNKLK